MRVSCEVCYIQLRRLFVTTQTDFFVFIRIYISSTERKVSTMKSSWTFLLCTHVLVTCLLNTKVHIQANTVRSFYYTVCEGRQVLGDSTTDVPAVTSRLNCVRRCLHDPQCRSCSYCTGGGSATCVLSTQQTSSCPALTTVDGQCSSQLMVSAVWMK